MTSYYSLGLSERLQHALQDIGFDEPTDFQIKVIPTLVQFESDMIVRTEHLEQDVATVYGPALIQRIDLDFKDTQAIVLVPDNERAVKVAEGFNKLASYLPKFKVTHVANLAIQDKMRVLRKGTHVLVATAEDVQDLIIRKSIDLSQVTIEVVEPGVVGDQAEVLAINEAIPGDRHIWLLENEVESAFKSKLTDPIVIADATVHENLEALEHSYCVVRPKLRVKALKRLIDAYPSWTGIVYCRTSSDANFIYNQLHSEGVSVAVVDAFNNAENQYDADWLIGTDFMGLHNELSNINTIIHYGLPDSSNEFLERIKLLDNGGNNNRSLVIATLKDVSRIKRLTQLLQLETEERLLPALNEIIQNQLLGLPERVEAVDPEIVQHLPFGGEVAKQLDEYSKEELVQRLMALELERFRLLYDEGEREQISEAGQQGYRRLFINLGTMDGFDWKDIKDYIRNRTELRKDEVLNVDVKRKFSFFTVAAQHADLLTSKFKDDTYNGRNISVEYSSNPDDNALKIWRKGAPKKHYSRKSFNAKPRRPYRSRYKRF